MVKAKVDLAEDIHTIHGLTEKVQDECDENSPNDRCR